MDTGEFFQNVARRNYFEFFERGDDIRTFVTMASTVSSSFTAHLTGKQWRRHDLR